MRADEVVELRWYERRFRATPWRRMHWTGGLTNVLFLSTCVVVVKAIGKAVFGSRGHASLAGNGRDQRAAALRAAKVSGGLCRWRAVPCAFVEEPPSRLLGCSQLLRDGVPRGRVRLTHVMALHDGSSTTSMVSSRWKRSCELPSGKCGASRAPFSPIARPDLIEP